MAESKFIGFVRLARPANVVTAIADILAGVAISGYLSNDASLSPVLWLALSTAALYGGGVVLNDFFDAPIDKLERPERPIPRGVVSLKEAAFFGVTLLAIGIASAYVVSGISALLALSIALAAVVYDKWAKHSSVLGPLTMGLCRGLNLLLGISIIGTMLQQYWFLAAAPVVYIAAITMISRGEVHGGGRKTLYGALLLYVVVVAFILSFAAQKNSLWIAIVFLTGWALFVFPPLFRAIQNPSGQMIGRAVKAGVIALILMDAAWASAFDAVYLAGVIVLLLPLSLSLARIFAVT